MSNRKPSAPGDGQLAALQPGAVFLGRYRVVRTLKAGGMGAVHEVTDELTNTHRALKVMLPSVVSDPLLRARFALEARVTGDIESDHLVRVSDAGVDEITGIPFLVMDLLRGEDLRAVIAARGDLPPDEVVTYLSQAAMALDKTHAAGIVHRDLKPDNLFVARRDDGSPCVKILDFGVAKVLAQGEETNPTAHAVGTPLYMAPEQLLKGKSAVGPRTDIHALGHLAYALLAGEPYWAVERDEGRSMFDLLSTILEGPKEQPVVRARRRRGALIPAAFDAWFAHATARDPEARFATASEAVAALATALRVAAPRPVTIPPAAGTRSRLVAAAAQAVQAQISGDTGRTGGTGRVMVADTPTEPRAPHRAGRWIALGAAVSLVAFGTFALLSGHDGQTPGPAGHDGGDPQTLGPAGHDGGYPQTPGPAGQPLADAGRDGAR